MSASDWLPIAICFVIGIAVFVLAGRLQRVWLVLLLRSIAILPCMLGCGLWALSGFGKVTYEAPVLSPDNAHSFRVRVADEGATGGSDQVVVRAGSRGEETPVYSGSWESVNRDLTRWLRPKELLIVYRGRVDVCTDTADVHVTCQTADRAPLPVSWASPFPRSEPSYPTQH